MNNIYESIVMNFLLGGYVLVIPLVIVLVIHYIKKINKNNSVNNEQQGGAKRWAHLIGLAILITFVMTLVLIVYSFYDSLNSINT
jgi:heme/copper-type cytochrome/quinol oxidase subunit 2